MSFAFLPLYTGDYLRDTSDLTLTEHGIYLRLLMFCWDSRGPVPRDEMRAARIVGATSDDERVSVGSILRRFFVEHDDGWYNPRMEAEVARANVLSAARSEAGRKGAGKTWSKSQAIARASDMAVAKAIAKASATTPTPTPTTTPTTTPTPTPPSQPAVAREEEKATPLAPPSAKKPPRGRPPTAKVWEAYATAYLATYGTEPVRNAMINGQMCNFVARIGAEEAPAVASSYLRNKSTRYIRGGHSVGLMLADAEKLRTEWARGQTIGAPQSGIDWALEEINRRKNGQ